MFDENKIYQIQWHFNWTDRGWQFSDDIQYANVQYFFY